MAPAAYSLDHIGPMAWTTEDCALMLQALAGYDATDPASANRPVPNYTAELPKGAKGLRIGVLRVGTRTIGPSRRPCRRASTMPSPSTRRWAQR